MLIIFTYTPCNIKKQLPSNFRNHKSVSQITMENFRLSCSAVSRLTVILSFLFLFFQEESTVIDSQNSFILLRVNPSYILPTNFAGFESLSFFSWQRPAYITYVTQQVSNLKFLFRLWITYLLNG